MPRLMSFAEVIETRLKIRSGCPRCNRFHRRAQLAEAALAAVDPERLERAGRSGGSLGRSLLRWRAAKMEEERDEALALCEELMAALLSENTQQVPQDPNGPALEAARQRRRRR